MKKKGNQNVMKNVFLFHIKITFILLIYRK